MHTQARPARYGRREPHTFIIARGDQVRHFVIRPWLSAFIGSALAAVAIGYLLATSYLVLRDDLIGGAAARQARVQQAYEDRIAALRAQVDRITSRQMLDQQAMATKVSELLERQSALTQRDGRLGPVQDRPAGDGAALVLPDAEQGGAPDDGPQAYAPAATRTLPASLAALNAATGAGSGVPAGRTLAGLDRALKAIEAEQLNRVDTLADGAYQRVDAITAALAQAGLPLDIDYGKKNVGGPLVPVGKDAGFDTKVQELDEALDSLDRVKLEIKKLPLDNPLPGLTVTSLYGVRKDPLLGSLAMHSGMDLRVPTGTNARVTAAGTVVKAGWNGGYGRMVEVDHGGGLVTRYAHLNEVLVKEGDLVTAGEVIGRTGSSGRSTGPHLHYEVRQDGAAVNPLPFLKAGREISRLL